MPMRWTPENDQLLLLKILETHELSVDTKKVAEAWPTGENQSKPTPRAISERLVKVRQQVRSSGAGDGHFGIGKGANASATSTPVKARAPKSTGSGPKTPASGKRKRPASKKKNGTDAEAEGDDDMDFDTPSKKPTAGVQGLMIKDEPDEDSIAAAADAAEDDSPKRVRKQASNPDMVGYPSGAEGLEDSDEVYGQGETSASEFMPDDSFDSGNVVKTEP